MLAITTFIQDWSLKLDIPPVSIKVEELETIADELDSKLEMKLKEMEEIKNEMKLVMDKFIQLKAKHDLIEDDPISQNNEHEVHMLYISILAQAIV